MLKPVILALALAMAPLAAAAQPPAARTLDIYFIDVEGGQSTLVVTPAGQTLLIDAGFPGPGGFDSRPGDAATARDPQRILEVAKLAGVTRIDYLLVTHFHGDHVGGVPELAQLLPIGTFIDHGGVNADAESVAGTLAMHQAYAAVRATGTAPRAEAGRPAATHRRRRHRRQRRRHDACARRSPARRLAPTPPARRRASRHRRRTRTRAPLGSCCSSAGSASSMSAISAARRSSASCARPIASVPSMSTWWRITAAPTLRIAPSSAHRGREWRS